VRRVNGVGKLEVTVAGSRLRGEGGCHDYYDSSPWGALLFLSLAPITRCPFNADESNPSVRGIGCLLGG
jgi:hypothetical protein